MKQAQIETAVVVSEPQPLARREEPQDLLRLAVEKGADVGTLERLMTVRRELMAERAKAEFDAALAAFQAECPIITKRKSGAKNAYKYAPTEDIVVQIRDLVRKHGFSYTLNAEVEPGWVKAKCLLKHVGGHSETTDFKVPIDNRNTMMNDAQKYAGALTFARRYCLVGALGITTADEDLDGRVDRPKPASPKVATAATRQWMIDQLKDIREKALVYAIDNALIMPNEGLEAWPLNEVPTSSAGLKELRENIEAHE